MKSLKNFFSSIHEEFDEDVNKWSSWPPDIFALTSIILEKSGWYKIVVENNIDNSLSEDFDDKCWINDSSWLEHIELITCEWELSLKNESKITESDNVFAGKINFFWGCLDKLTLEDLKLPISKLLSNNESLDRKEIIRFILIVIELHSSADQLCCNYGISRASLPTDGFREYKANVKLLMTGTLSNISTVYGIVLPKLRVPKVGLSLRSMSHNICFINTEVEVIWRNINWMNIDQDTLNILVVPIPSEIPTNYFKSSKKAIRDSYDSADYFDYEPFSKINEYKDIGNYIIELILKSLEQSSRVHMIVFPELSLSYEDFEKVKTSIFKKLKYHQIPLIVAGLRSIKKSNGLSCKTNSVVLSSFFAGKWYDLIQNKHHRWRLDSSQIDCYGLSGVLHGGGGWWENTQLKRRQLAFLSANGWLNLCPLICEDLARIEPVSDVIRSVGPNLLIAVLLDGPQIISRWPARYATVFAEDPGTSVLTVTALGMCKRSKPINVNFNHCERTVALWKDDSGNFREISLDDDAEAVLLTIEAKKKLEHTAHGISDNMSACQLVLRNVQQVCVKNYHDTNFEEDNPIDIKFENYKKILLNDGDDYIKELSVFSLATNAYLLTPTKDIRKAFDTYKVKYKYNKLINDSSRVGDNLSKDVDELIDDLFNILKEDTPTKLIMFSCSILIRMFESVESERDNFFTKYDEFISNEDVNSKREFRTARSKYLESLSEECLCNIDITKDRKNGFNRAMEKVKNLLGRDIKYEKGVDELKYLRFFQAVNLCIVWSIHNYLTDSDVKNYNSKKEHDLINKLEEVSDVDVNLHEIHIDPIDE